MRVFPRRAAVLTGEPRAAGEDRVCRILTFFGVPWVPVEPGHPLPADDGGEPYAIVASARDWERAHGDAGSAAVVSGAVAAYVYSGDSADERAATRRVLTALAGCECEWTDPAAGSAVAAVTDAEDEFTGPMSGLHVTLPASSRAGFAFAGGGTAPATIVSVGGVPVFVRVTCHGTPVYVCARPVDVDLDAPVANNYYDVKTQFLAAVPLVMFITWAFREVMWRPRELGACL